MIVDDYLSSYTMLLRDLGAIRTSPVERAFRTVRRDRCLTQFYLSRDERIDVRQDVLPQPAVLDRVYADNTLVTRFPPLDDLSAASSSSLPSLMAQMLEALELEPGHRVLEIGAGTGYNAALITTITGGLVVSIDVQPDVVTDARQSMRRLDVNTVTVHCADGYGGAPSNAPYQRIIVTVACTGVSPHFLEQLDSGGLIIAPIAHGGAHPVLAVRVQDAAAAARAVLWTGFMHATGPLHQWPDAARPMIIEPLQVAEFTEHGGFLPPLTRAEYTDLHFFMATRDPRITETFAPAVHTDRAKGRCTLIDPRRGAAFIKVDSVALAGDATLLDEISRLGEDWEHLGRPKLSDWQCDLIVAGDPATPVLVPARWRCQPE